MSTYRATGPVPVDTADGRVLGPGDTVEDLDHTDPHNARLIQAGFLRLQRDPAVRASAKSPKPPTKTELQERARELEVEGRSTMTVDELREAVATAEADQTEDTASPAGNGGEGVSAT
jgi:hypothetical protein